MQRFLLQVYLKLFVYFLEEPNRVVFRKRNFLLLPKVLHRHQDLSYALDEMLILRVLVRQLEFRCFLQTTGLVLGLNYPGAISFPVMTHLVEIIF